MNPARILVVDDNTADVNLLRLALDQQEEDYVLEVAESGEAALAVHKGTQTRFTRARPLRHSAGSAPARYDGLRHPGRY